MRRKTITYSQNASQKNARASVAKSRKFISKHDVETIRDVAEIESLLFFREYTTNSDYRFFMLVSVERSKALKNGNAINEQNVEGYLLSVQRKVIDDDLTYLMGHLTERYKSTLLNKSKNIISKISLNDDFVVEPLSEEQLLTSLQSSHLNMPRTSMISDIEKETGEIINTTGKTIGATTAVLVGHKVLGAKTLSLFGGTGGASLGSLSAAETAALGGGVAGAFFLGAGIGTMIDKGLSAAITHATDGENESLGSLIYDWVNAEDEDNNTESNESNNTADDNDDDGGNAPDGNDDDNTGGDTDEEDGGNAVAGNSDDESDSSESDSSENDDGNTTVLQDDVGEPSIEALIALYIALGMFSEIFNLNNQVAIIAEQRGIKTPIDGFSQNFNLDLLLELDAMLGGFLLKMMDAYLEYKKSSGIITVVDDPSTLSTINLTAYILLNPVDPIQNAMRSAYLTKFRQKPS